MSLKKTLMPDYFDTVESSVDYTLTSNVEDLTLTDKPLTGIGSRIDSALYVIPICGQLMSRCYPTDNITC